MSAVLSLTEAVQGSNLEPAVAVVQTGVWIKCIAPLIGFAPFALTLASRLLWRDGRDDSLGLPRGWTFQFAMLQQFDQNFVHHLLAFFNVGKLSPLELNVNHDLVFFFEEGHGLADLDFDIVMTSLGPKSNFLELG